MPLSSIFRSSISEKLSSIYPSASSKDWLLQDLQIASNGSGHVQLQSLVFGISVNAGGNQRKGHRLISFFFHQVQRCPITGFQNLLFLMLTIPPTRADCIYHIFAWQTVSFCDFCAAALAAMQHTALCKQFRSGGTMNAAVHTPPPKREVLAALTIASMLIFVISFLIICNGMKHTILSAVSNSYSIIQIRSNYAKLPQPKTRGKRAEK